MKITHASRDRLEIGVRPGVFVWLLRGIVALLLVMGLAFVNRDLWLLGGFVLVTGLVFLYVAADLGRSIRVIFDRPGDTFDLRISGLLGTRTTTHPLGEISHAEVREGRPNTGPSHHLGRPARPVILTTGYTEIPLNDFFETGPGPVEITAAVNAWLEGR